MSTTDISETEAFADYMAAQQQADRPFTRVYEADLAEGDGRTLDLRIVPYNTVATVSDPPDFTPYRELFLPGAFDGQMRAANRIWLNFEHEQGLRGIIGLGSELRDHDNGLHGTFRVGADSDAEKALQYVHDGALTGVSLEFRARKTQVVDNVRQRVKAIVDRVSLCRFPAYPEAQVVAVRTQPAELPPLLDPAVDELLTRVGYEPLLCRAVTSRPWDGSPARFSDEQYLHSCLIVRAGDGPAKDRGSLPVLEPNGDLNTNALGAAAAALAGARGGVRNITAAQKAAAARKLLRYYGQASMEPPMSVKALAATA